jgi:hypothetical protein
VEKLGKLRKAGILQGFQYLKPWNSERRNETQNVLDDAMKHKP